MRVTLGLTLCLSLVLKVSAAEPYVDDTFLQNDVQNIRELIASVTADQIESITADWGDEHVAGAIPRKALNTARDGTQSWITIYVRTDRASVITSDKNHVRTEYRVRKGPQGWAMEIAGFNWFDYPVECLWYLLPGLIVHPVFFGLGCIFLVFVKLYTRSGYRKLLGQWGLFNIVFLLVASAMAGLWSCLIVGHFYTSSDYISDFSPLIPITQNVIDAPFGNLVGHLNGITLRQLQLLWMVFAVITWVLALSIYFCIRRLRSSPSERPDRSLEPTAGRGEVHI